MSIQEAIQLSLALEESERYAKEEAANRTKLQVRRHLHTSVTVSAEQTCLESLPSHHVWRHIKIKIYFLQIVGHVCITSRSEKFGIPVDPAQTPKQTVTCSTCGRQC